jgi:hypothetical protein
MRPARIAAAAAVDARKEIEPSLSSETIARVATRLYRLLEGAASTGTDLKAVAREMVGVAEELPTAGGGPSR